MSLKKAECHYLDKEADKVIDSSITIGSWYSEARE